MLKNRWNFKCFQGCDILSLMSCLKIVGILMFFRVMIFFDNVISKKCWKCTLKENKKQENKNKNKNKENKQTFFRHQHFSISRSLLHQTKWALLFFTINLKILKIYYEKKLYSGINTSQFQGVFHVLWDFSAWVPILR